MYRQQNLGSASSQTPTSSQHTHTADEGSLATSFTMDVPLKPHGATVAGNPSNGLVNQSLEFSGAVRGLTPQTEVDTGRTVSNARHRDVSASSSAAFAQASGQTTNPDRVLDGDDEQTPRLRHAVLADSQSSSIAAAERNAWPPYVQRPPQHVAHLGLVNQLGPQAYGPMNGGSIPRLGSVPGPAPDNWWTELGNPVLTVNHIHDSRGWNSDQMLNGGNQVFYGANGGDQYGTRIGTFSSSPIPGFRSHGTGGYGPNGYLLVLQIHIPGRLPLPLRGLVWLSSDISFFREGTATQLGLVREQIPPKIRCSSITPLGLVTPTHFTRFVASIGEYQIPTTELAVKVIGWEDPSVDIFLGRAFFSRVGLPVERLVHQPMQPETHGKLCHKTLKWLF